LLGTVLAEQRDSEWIGYKVKVQACVSVTVTGTGSKYTAMSDSGGQFLMSVRPGMYRVEVDSSVAEQTIYSEIYTHVKSLHLDPGQCAQLQYQGVHR
jgi:hypothetical protein